MQASETNNNHHFASIADAKAFALAGNATLTLQSLKTSTHFTYKVREARDNTDLHFVNLLHGPNNETDYVYLGVIRADRFMLTKASKANEDSGCFKAFDYFWNRTNGTIPATLAIRHAGRCGRCGRTLTTPESLDSGYGPECAELLGLDL